MPLAAADTGEFEIDEEAPEFGRGFCVRADGGDEEVVKDGVITAVEREMFQLGGGVEGGGWSVAWSWVGV